MSLHAAAVIPEAPQGALLEIHARGQEAVAFGIRLFHMYHTFAEQWGWTTQTIWPPPAQAGVTVMDAVLHVWGDAYVYVQQEHGSHQLRDARASSRGARAHSSRAQVIVLPGPQPEEVICNEADLRLDLFRHSDSPDLGIKATHTVLRLTHVPTGVAVLCHSPHNSRQVMPGLFALQAHLRAQQQGAPALSHADRIVRTYDLAADHIIDTRLRHPLPGATKVLSGDLGLLIEALFAAGS